MTDRRVTLYVKSVRTLVGAQEFEYGTVMRKVGSRPSRVEVEGKIMNGTFQIKTYETETQPKYQFKLPEDQTAIAEMVRRLCKKHGFELKIIDVTKENVLHRALQEEIEKIRTFPTLVNDSSRRLEGNMTKEQTKLLLLKVKRV